MDFQPSTSSMDAKGTKRKADGSAYSSPKRSKIDNEDNKSKEYETGGLKFSFHGVVFQVKLLMLFIHRAINLKCKFNLATDMKMAEKFDDVVFEYEPNDPSKRNFIFVQAKHKNDSKNKKITINDLKSENDKNAFSLQKYFISFCKIKRNPHFRNAESSKYFIVTNTDFDFIGNETQKSNELIKEWRQYIKLGDKLCDKILYFRSDDFEPKVYKLCDYEGGLKKMMKQNLLNSALRTKKIKEFKSISVYFHLILKLRFSPDLVESIETLEDFKLEKEDNKENRKETLLTKDKLKKMANDAIKLYKNVFAEKVTQDDIKKMAEETNELFKEKEAGKCNTDEFKKKVLERYTNAFVGELAKEKLEKGANKVIDILEKKEANNVTNMIKETLELNKDLDEAKKELECSKRGETTEKQIDDVLSETEALLKIVEDELDRVENESQKMISSNENDGLKGEKNKFEEYVNQLKRMTNQLDLDSNQAITLFDNVREASIIEVALDNDKFDEHFVEFIKYFRIVTNYPNESELGALIGDELKDVFNLLNADLAYAEFERQAFNFLKVYKLGKAPFHNQVKAFKDFEDLMTKIVGLMISGYGRSYPEKLNQYGIKFNETIEELDDFLKTENETKIFQLITQPTRLGAIKVLQSLDAIDEYREKKDSLIFMRLRTLLRKETQKQVLKSFKSEKFYNLIVVEIQNKIQDKDENSRNQSYFEFVILEKLLRNNPCKKVIVIDSKERDYDFGSETKIEEIKFEDFDENSQNKILEREVNFQGNNIQWNQLINNTAAKGVFDHLILSRIIENEQISIGNQSAFSSIGYVEDCYIERKFRHPVMSKKIIKDKSEFMKLFITGVDEKDLINFGVKSDDIEEIKLIDIKQNEDCDFKKYTGKSIIIPPSVRGHKFYKSEWENVFNNVHWLHRVFIKIFHELGDNVHWLHYTQSCFFWMNSKNDPTELLEFVQTDDDENALVCNATLDEIHFAEIKSSVPRTTIDTNDKNFIRLESRVEHLGRSEIKIESTNQHGFMRPDLNYYANNWNLNLELPDEYVQLCLQDFDEGDKAKAKELFEKLATPCDPNDLIAEIENSVRRTIIVANDAGMGKSTVLTSLAIKMRQLDHNNKKPTNYRWIVRINLNDFANEAHKTCLELILFDEDSTAEAIEFVTQMVIPGDPKNDLVVRLQQQIFKLSLKKSKKEKKTPNIVLMFDGFDEITPFYKQKTIKLVKALQASQVAQIWISTRVHELLDLQENLNSLGFVMTPLSYENQIKFANNFWKWQLKFKTKSNGEICKRDSQDTLDILKSIKLPVLELNTCISELVKEFDKNHHQIELEELREAIDKLNFSNLFEGMIRDWNESIKDDENKFTINPLQLKMLTEVAFAEKFQLSDFGLSNLYEKFIEMKFYIYFKEKEKRIKGNQGADETGEDTLELSYKVHEALAVAHFFPEICEKMYSFPNFDVLNRFKSNGQGNEEKEKLKYARIGMLVLNGGRLEFIHKSFAEFFLSKYLIRNARDPENQKVQKLLLPQILVGDNYKLVRDFFNKQLEKTEIRINLSEKSMNLINDHLEKNEGSFMSFIENDHNKILEQLLEGSSKMTEGLIEKHIWNFKNISKLILLGQNDKIEIILRFVKQNEKYTRTNLDYCITKTCEFFEIERRDKYTRTLKNAIRTIFGMDRLKKLFKSRLTLTSHGVEFQKKLLMLFIHRATRIGYEFWLATEMNIAKNFDNVVLKYSKPNEPSKRNFILHTKQ